jgi:hypothetical protein
MSTTLPPGQCYAMALNRTEQNEWQDPDFLDGLSRQAVTFSLFEGEARVIALRLFAHQ